jgi:hypothetical protein
MRKAKFPEWRGRNLPQFQRAARTGVETSRFFEVAVVLLRIDHVVRFIVNADHSIVRAAEELRIIDCIRRLFVP